MVREILVNWTTLAGGGQVSVFHFDEVLPVASARADLGAFLNSIRGAFAASTSYTVATSGRDLDPSTGTLTGFWEAATPYTGSGSGGAQGPDAAQVLVRWRTEDVVNGRRVQGRTFIPGVGLSALTGGNVTASTVTNVVTAGNALAAAADSQLYVWHRPVNGAGGSNHSVTSAGCWTEVAVQRGRRG